jgi:exodeoxyribonuclease VII small subunit
MTKKEIPDEIKALSFEQALDELKDIVISIERGDGGLDASINLYEKGSMLKAHCEQRLKDARMKVEQISLSSDGTASVQPFDNEE